MLDPEDFPSPPEKPVAALLGIIFFICKVSMLVTVVVVILVFQEKNEKEKILEDLRKANITQNNSSIKELLTNRTLEYDILKHKMDQTINRFHGKDKTAAKPLQITGKTYEGHWTCYGIKCYYFIIDNKTWEKCKQTCQNHRLSLLKIDDKDELGFVRPLLGANHYWIGLFFDTGGNRWKWMGSGTSSGTKGVLTLDTPFG
ncbi:PREDICTED: T-cell surface glycoprotein YE1/48-like [Chinchilla lanigera]|uniref:T-cell surface glycoprotein YE1/48-like n=1 Tax=Chinchilla lanigera TaxID=34839 RepID=UPI00038EB290|nr:PREDICTED: T-cell surface glycoprotein YE1/48-like [Chinchilla lanigera]